jgi:hypothetical protein
MKPKILFLAFLALLFTSALPFGRAVGHLQGGEIAPGCAVIEGRVVDEAGQPLVGAKVYSMVIDHPGRGRLPSTITDAEGRFSLKCAELGKNGVYVSKEGDGYPDSLFTPFLDRSLIPIVDAPDQKTIAGLEVHAPPRSGRLSIRVIDRKTLGASRTRACDCVVSMIPATATARTPILAASFHG